jgi:hypothetical protein
LEEFMPYSLKRGPTRLVPLALAMFLIVFGASVSKLSAQESQIGNSCSPCMGQQQAAEDTARAQEALRQGLFEADKYRGQAAQAIQQGNQSGAEYDSKANALLENNTGVACNACGEKVITPPSCSVQQEAADVRAQGAKAQQQALDEASQYSAKADQAIQDSKQKAVQYNLDAIRHLEEGAASCNTCATVTCNSDRPNKCTK